MTSMNDNYPISKYLVKKRFINVIDKSDGSIKVLELSQNRYNELMEISIKKIPFMVRAIKSIVKLFKILTTRKETI